MQLISETIVLDTGKKHMPLFPQKYQTPIGFNLGSFKEWKNGQPWDYYAQLHQRAPISWMQPVRSGEDGFWALVDYQAIRDCSVNSEVFSSQRGSINMTLRKRRMAPQKLLSAIADAFINFDPPIHNKVRTQLMSYFTPKYANELKAKVDDNVTELLDNMEMAARQNGGVVDMAKVLSAQVPISTVCTMLGIDSPAERQRIAHWMWYLEQAQALSFDTRHLITHPHRMLGLIGAMNDMFAFGAKQVEDRRRNPRQDLMTAIAEIKVDDQYLREEYINGAWALIVFGANDTTKNTISGLTRLLTQNPDQRAKLLNDRSLLNNAIMEALRMISPVIHMRRTATQDTEVLGQKIAQDEKILYYYGAANRDPKIFENPDVFNIERPNAKQHLAFGYGGHLCLGRMIGVMQLTAVYEQILDRFPNIEWTGEMHAQPNNFVAAVESQMVRLNK